MKLVVKVDTKRVSAAFAKFPQAMSRELRVAMKKEMSGVQRYARRNHRFITRSSMLARSVQTKVSTTGLFGEVYLDTGLAVYGPRIHRGWGTWRADKFLTMAFKKFKPSITANLTRAVHDAIRKVGLT